MTLPGQPTPAPAERAGSKREIDPIGIAPAYQTLAAALRARILDRSLREGERLPAESELARHFGVNRSTVREALRQLQAAGLLSRRHGSKRLAVSHPAPNAVAQDVSCALSLYEVSYRDVWEGLTMLEPPIAEAAARRRTLRDLERIESTVECFAREAAHTARAVQHVAGFFRRIGAATHNRVLMLSHEPLLQLLAPSLDAMIDRVPQARSRILTAQRHILAALTAEDAPAARRWTERHIRDFRRGYELAGIPLATPCHRGPAVARSEPARVPAAAPRRTA